MRFATTLLATSFVLFASLSAQAEPSWIKLFIDAHGGCATDETLDDALQGRNGTSWHPFDRDPADWTDQDLVDLKTELDRCRQTVEAVGTSRAIHVVHDEIGIMLAEIPPLVGLARQKQALARKALKPAPPWRSPIRTKRRAISIACSTTPTPRRPWQPGPGPTPSSGAKLCGNGSRQPIRRSRAIAPRRPSCRARRNARSRKPRGTARRPHRTRAGAGQGTDASPAGKTAEADAAKPDGSAQPDRTHQPRSAAEFDRSADDLLSRLSQGASGSVVKPVLTNTISKDGRIVRAYMVGQATAVYFDENKNTGHVQDVVVLVSRSTTEQISLGLLTFVSVLDIVSPELTEEMRGQIAQQMVERVFADNGTYTIGFGSYALVCRAVKGAWCTFTPKA